MIGLFRKRQAPPSSLDSSPRVPQEMRIYAIGDIHGRYDLLRQLQALILADAASHPTKQKTIVYLGDYIDRGPESREVIEHLSGQPLPGFTSIHLLGNHEQALLGFLQRPDAYANWLQYGGLATLVSYGVRANWSSDSGVLNRMGAELAANLPDRHRAFLAQLDLYRVLEDYLFVHAGIRPAVPIAIQNPDDMLWIRDEFLHYKKPHPYVIVHGHHIHEEPEVKANRIGIDTGAFATGRLTCLVLDGDTRAFIDTRGKIIR
jgi:serine/threonine protein phosphatase 1